MSDWSATDTAGATKPVRVTVPIPRHVLITHQRLLMATATVDLGTAMAVLDMATAGRMAARESASTSDSDVLRNATIQRLNRQIRPTDSFRRPRQRLAFIE